MIELLLLLAAAAVMGGGSSSPTITAYVVPMGGGGVSPPPPLPTQGDGFREGAQPDPAAPNDPNRGRFFAMWGQSKYEGRSAEHDGPVLQLALDANGIVRATIWATRAGKPERCTAWITSIPVKEGRVVYAEQKWQYVTCGAKDVTWTDPGGCTLPLPVVRWEQRGPTLFLLWKTQVNGKASESDDDCDEALGFYVDVLWRFE